MADEAVSYSHNRLYETACVVLVIQGSVIITEPWLQSHLLTHGVFIGVVTFVTTNSSGPLHM